MATIVDTSGDRMVVSLEYSVKQDGFEDGALQPAPPGGHTGWEPFTPLSLPDEADDTSVIAREAEAMRATSGAGGYLMRSRYASAGLTDHVAAQLVSRYGHLYVFRQSTEGRVLVDRFVLDGITNTLTPKIEVRHERSRQR